MRTDRNGNEKIEVHSPINKIRNFINWIGSKDFDHVMCKRLNIPNEPIQIAVNALNELITCFEKK